MSISVDEPTYNASNDYESQDGSGYYRKHSSQLTPAKTVLLHRNGDRFFVGRKFVVNRRHVPTFEHFLMEVTRRVPLDLGAAQRIYTPRQGHRVHDLEGLQQGQVLVAAGKESFKKIDYFQIAPRKSELKKEEVIKPVVHSRIVVSSKWANYQRDSCTLNVFKNGDMLMPPVRMLLSKHMLKDWNRALAAISEKVHPSVGAVQRLYTIDGHRVSSGEIENNQHYVAVGREKFKRLPYHQWLPKLNQVNAVRPSAHSLGSAGSGVSIRGGRYGARLMQQRRAYHRSAQAQSEGRKKGQSDHGSVHSFEDDESDTFFKQVYQDPNFTDKEDTSVCHATSKQSKHSIDLPPSMTKHDRGVFRACASRDEIHGAAEVQEDKQIKIELPIDQVSAEVVDEEDIPVNLRKSTQDTTKHDNEVPLHSLQGSKDSTQTDEKKRSATISKQVNYFKEQLLMEKALKEHMAFEKQPVIPYTAMKACLVLGRVVLGSFCSKIMASPSRFLVLPPCLEASRIQPLILKTSSGAIASRRLTLPPSSAASSALVLSPPSLGKTSTQPKPLSLSGVSSKNASVVSPPS